MTARFGYELSNTQADISASSVEIETFPTPPENQQRVITIRIGNEVHVIPFDRETIALLTEDRISTGG